jgi:hypothetical protein
MKKTVKSVEVQLCTIDQLAWMSDDELIDLMLNLEKSRERAVSRGNDSRNVEIELCYSQREWDIRKARQAAHAVWSARPIVNEYL